jgi:hypothetical protein
MTGRRAIVGLCILCAFALSAIAAQGASAKGLRTFTCVSTAPVKDFSTEHCVPGQTGTSFGHESFTEDTPATSTNAKTDATTTGRTNWVLKETIAATNLELESTGAVESLGEARNEEVGGEWRAIYETDENGTTINGVVVKAPAGKGCKVFEDNEGTKGAEGVIKTKPLKTDATIVIEAGQEVHSAVVEPKAPGSPFATFFVECEPGKVPAELEGTWQLTGKITCPLKGATTVCEHNTITSANTLKGKGAKAGLSGKTTKAGGKTPAVTHPLSVTTVP